MSTVHPKPDRIRPRLARVLAALAALALTLGSAGASAFDVQDFLSLKRLSEPDVSPDGKYATFTLRSDDLNTNQGRTSIWLLDTTKRGAAPRRLSGDTSHDSAAAWSRDGQFIYFLSSRSGSAQVWRMAAAAATASASAAAGGGAGAEPAPVAAVQVTKLPLDVGSFRIAPTGDRLLVSLEVFRDCDDLACTKQRLEVAEKSTATGVLYDRLFVRHWDTWSDGRRSQLYSLLLDAQGIATGAPVNLTAGIDGDVPGKPFGGREDYAISPDGKQVVFSVRIAGSSEPWSTNFDLYAVPAGGGAARNLTADNPAWDGQPAFSPDGGTLAYVATDRPGFEADRFHLVLLNMASGVKRPLTEHWDRSIVELRVVAGRQDLVRDRRTPRAAAAVGNRRRDRSVLGNHRGGHGRRIRGRTAQAFLCGEQSCEPARPLCRRVRRRQDATADPGQSSRARRAHARQL